MKNLKIQINGSRTQTTGTALHFEYEDYLQGYTYAEYLERKALITAHVETIRHLVANQDLTRQPNNVDDLITSRQVCEEFNVSERKLRRLRDSGKLSFIKVETRVFFDQRAVSKILKRKTA